MEAKWTPGPWKRCVEGNTNTVRTVLERGAGEIICRCIRGDKGHFSDDANAVLIASAPTLAALLGRMLDRYIRLVNSGDAGNWDPEIEDIVKESRAVLKGLGL